MNPVPWTSKMWPRFTLIILILVLTSLKLFATKQTQIVYRVLVSSSFDKLSGQQKFPFRSLHICSSMYCRLRMHIFVRNLTSFFSGSFFWNIWQDGCFPSRFPRYEAFRDPGLGTGCTSSGKELTLIRSGLWSRCWGPYNFCKTLGDGSVESRILFFSYSMGRCDKE